MCSVWASLKPTTYPRSQLVLVDSVKDKWQIATLGQNMVFLAASDMTTVQMWVKPEPAAYLIKESGLQYLGLKF